MKKFLSVLCTLSIINLTMMPAFCEIVDEFVEKTLSKDLQIKNIDTAPIRDTFAEQNLDANLTVKEYRYIPIYDAFAQNNTRKNPPIKRVAINEILPIVQISPVDTELKTKRNIITDTKNSIPVEIKIKNAFSTKGNFQEGDYITFETLHDVTIDNTLYKKGSTVKARVETISENKIWGVPADLIVGNFSIQNTPLTGEISKTGANRALWLYPTVYFTTFLFGMGLLLIPVRGGHAKINANEKFTIYANPTPI